MDFLRETYYQNPSFYNCIIGLLIFGGIGRLAYWRDYDGLRVGGPLALGLALLLTLAILIWADENNRTIQEFGPYAAGLIVGVIFMTGINAFRKGGQL